MTKRRSDTTMYPHGATVGFQAPDGGPHGVLRRWCARRAFTRRAFTLIELLVVVIVISILSGILLPVLIRARDRARKVAAERSAAQPVNPRLAPQRPAIPSGARPVLDDLDLEMALAASYHRIGMDVFTRYRVDCAGTVAFRHPGGTDERVVLTIPFPHDTVEARDVRLTVRGAGAEVAGDVVYDRTGIHWTGPMPPDAPLTADVRFTAFGRERFDYALPPARQLRSVTVTLKVSGADSWTIPDDSLQPSATAAGQVRWDFDNLVSERQISILIPGAQAPLARVLLLSRLVALAVLLFGAGFWFLSEQYRPGQLDSFRLGHFLLLALTYSLFFVLFAVLEFDGRLSTPASMAISAVFSLPLLVLHVSRVLDLRFAATRVVPLALFTLGLVINGVYGGPYRDYAFIAATVFAVGYATVVYPTWAAGKERHRQEQDAIFLARRRAIVERITTEIAARVSELTGAQAQAESMARGASAAVPRTDGARETVAALRKEYDDLAQRLGYLPRERAFDTAQTIRNLEREADAFQERLEPQLARVRAETAAYRDLLHATGDGLHCVACGRPIPDSPFCPHCGTPRPRIDPCPACGERLVVPVHLLDENQPLTEMHCIRCGTRVAEPVATRTNQEPTDG